MGGFVATVAGKIAFFLGAMVGNTAKDRKKGPLASRS